MLPDIDCSGNPEISVQLLSEIKLSGVQNVVLTPHFYPQHNNNVEDFLRTRNKNINVLLKKMQKHQLTDINLIPAAEVLLCPGLEKMENLKELCIQDTNVILIEMPDLPWSEMLFDSLLRIKNKLGLDIVIAHADRYGKHSAEILVKMGFKIQVNSDSVVSLPMMFTIQNWAKNGWIYALGSDKHVHSDKKSHVYKEFPKASAKLKNYADVINERSLKLIGK